MLVASIRRGRSACRRRTWGQEDEAEAGRIQGGLEVTVSNERGRRVRRASISWTAGVYSSNRAMVLRLSPLRPLGWLAIVLGLLVASTSAGFTDTLASDWDVSSKTASARPQGHTAHASPARPYRHKPIKLPHVSRHEPSAHLTAATASAPSASEASEGSWKDDAAVGCLPGRYTGPATRCTTLPRSTERVVASRPVLRANPRAPPAIS